VWPTEPLLLHAYGIEQLVTDGPVLLRCTVSYNAQVSRCTPLPPPPPPPRWMYATAMSAASLRLCSQPHIVGAL
jgi:hypothetical protein